jgi:hypothetical protein
MLKAIIALGHQMVIKSPQRSSVEKFKAMPEDKLIKRLGGSKGIALTELQDIWQSQLAKPSLSSSKLCICLAERIRDVGSSLFAYDIVLAGLKRWPQSVRLKQLLGLTLADIGATGRANQVLSDLYTEGKIDGETLGILARTYKDLWVLERQPQKRKEKLKKGFKFYSEGFQWALDQNMPECLDGAVYNGINAATTALVLGEDSQARSLANKVLEACEKKLEENPHDYWALASKGEAALILKEWNMARDLYSQAAETGKSHYQRLSSTRRQARILLEHLGKDKYLLDHCFRIPRVIVFTGHAIDPPGQPEPIFPQKFAIAVRREIEARLEKLDAGIGYSSAACGSDILFLEAMLKRRGEINVMLPFKRSQFKRTRVDIIPRALWGKRFTRALKQAAQVRVASAYHRNLDPAIDEFAALLLDGMANLRAKMLDTEMKPVVVWDGRTSDIPGGVSSQVQHWRSYGIEPEIIFLSQIISHAARSNKDKALKKHIPLKFFNGENPPGIPKQIKGIVFADVVGYEKLTKKQVPIFTSYLKKAVEKILDEFPTSPFPKSTWNDTLYFVFDSIKNAGNFAILLQNRMCGIDWANLDLPRDLDLRISIDTGALAFTRDPIIKKSMVTGSEVFQAARFGTSTPPGQVYASQKFAALASSQRLKDFVCEYVGPIPIPEKNDSTPLYLVRGISELPTTSD